MTRVNFLFKHYKLKNQENTAYLCIYPNYFYVSNIFSVQTYFSFPCFNLTKTFSEIIAQVCFAHALPTKKFMQQLQNSLLAASVV